MHVPLNDLERGYAEQADELRAVCQEVLESGWYVHGPHHDRFEEQLADFVGTAGAVGVGNGTDALTLAVLAVTDGRRGEVLTAANAGGYTTAAAARVGYDLRYADVDVDTLNLTPTTVESALTPQTVAVVVTHLYGRMAPVHEIKELCAARGVPVVEDCAQSAGAYRRGAAAGSVGDAGAFSFYPTKNLGALGDGGAVTASDPAILERLKELRQYGWGEKYVMGTPDGANSRLDELQAAVLGVRLPRLSSWNARRRDIIGCYRSASEGGSRLRVLPAPDERHVGHLAVALSDDRDAVRSDLAAAGIATAVHYPVPDHQQPINAAQVALPVTEMATASVLSLPCFPQMTDDEVQYVCAALASL